MSTRNAVALALLAGLVGFFSARLLDPTRNEGITTHSGADRAGAIPPSDPAGSAVVEARGAIAEALAETDVLLRSPKLAAVLERLGPEQAETVRSALRLSLGDLSAADYDLFLGWWSRVDPEGAVTWTLNHAPRGYRTLAPSVSVYAWAKQDPEAALQALEASLGRLSDDSADFAIRALIRGWYDSGREDVHEYLSSLSAGMKRDIAVSALARTIALRRGGPAAVEWAESLPEHEASEDVSPIDSPMRQKRTALRRVAAELGRVDPELGKVFVQRHSARTFADEILKQFAVAFFGQDGPSAAAWLSEQPPTPMRDESLRIGFRYWLTNDPEGARRWALDASPAAEPWRLAAALQIATNLAGSAPEHALAWAEAIEDPRVRANAIVISVRRWRRTDPSAADQWLKSAEISEETLKRAQQ